MLHLDESTTEQLFRAITRRPKLILVVSLALIIGLAAGLSQLVKDTSVKAFIPPDHPSLLADDLVESIFGISDSLAVALVFERERGVFTPEALTLIAKVTEELKRLPNVRPERVNSLATESSIRGKDGSVYVDPYLIPGAIDQAAAEDSFARWLKMPLTRIRWSARMHGRQ